MSNTPLPDPQDKERYVRAMFDEISSRYDLVNRVMTFGLDQSWRRKALKASYLKNGEILLDVATGTGDFLVLATNITPYVIGIDLSFGMLKHSRSAQPLVQGSALDLPLADESVDVITCGFALRNFKDIPQVLSEFHRILKADGRVAILEVSTPSNRLVEVLHKIYFNKIVPELGALLSSPKAYRYLPASVAYLPPPDQLTELFKDARFSGIIRKELSFGVSQLFLARKDLP